MLLFGKSGLSALLARHASTLPSVQNDCQRETPSRKNKILAFP